MRLLARDGGCSRASDTGKADPSAQPPSCGVGGAGSNGKDAQSWELGHELGWSLASPTCGFPPFCIHEVFMKPVGPQMPGLGRDLGVICALRGHQAVNYSVCLAPCLPHWCKPGTEQSHVAWPTGAQGHAPVYGNALLSGP